MVKSRQKSIINALKRKVSDVNTLRKRRVRFFFLHLSNCSFTSMSSKRVTYFFFVRACIFTWLCMFVCVHMCMRVCLPPLCLSGANQLSGPFIKRTLYESIASEKRGMKKQACAPISVLVFASHFIFISSFLTMLTLINLIDARPRMWPLNVLICPV